MTDKSPTHDIDLIAVINRSGLSALDDDLKKSLAQACYEELELRVGQKLAEQMTDRQLEEFEKFIDEDAEDEALSWLEQNYPNYKDIVKAQVDQLQKELEGRAADILEPPKTDLIK